ncbi:MAG: DUF998 domain-containing protein [Thermomicrobiales bacterium]
MAQASPVPSQRRAILEYVCCRQATAAFLAGGALAPLLFLPLLLIAGRFTPGYGHMSSTFSDAASQGSPRPEFVTAGLVIVALCLMMTAVGLARTMPAHQLLVRTSLAISAAGILATAAFQDYNRASGVPRNREGMLHNAFAIVTIFAIEITILVVWRAIRYDQSWHHLSMPAMASFVIVAMAGVAFNYGPDSHDGLAERVLAGTAFLFLTSLCLTGLRQVRGAPLGLFPVRRIHATQPASATLMIED